MIVITPTRVEHHFWLTKKTNVAPALNSQQPGHILLKSGNVLVSLPPHGGKVVKLNTASSVSDFAVVGQAFINAVQQELLTEFRFANDHDKSAALSAMFTATVRPALPALCHAPQAIMETG